MARPARRTGNLPAEAASFIGRRRELAEVRRKLTEARLVSLVGPGGEAALRLALGQDQADGSMPATGLLARREADVARLIADGLTNRQIGARLFISERTVDSHVRSILNKLGFSSRAQVAAWVAGPDGV